MSQRAWAEAANVPRSSLQNWLRRKEKLSGSRALVDFMESPDGLAFLHVMVVALHLVFTKNGCGSIRNIVDFLKKTGLDAFVASSVGHHHEMSRKMDDLLVAFGEEESCRLGKLMPAKNVALGEDETFHPQICLVVMELISGYILGEGYVEKRDGANWKKLVAEALEGLPVNPIQVTGDEGKAIVYHAEKVLGAHRNSDLFHVNQEVVRGATGPLAVMERQAQNQYDKAMARTPAAETGTSDGLGVAGRLRAEPKPKLQAEQEKATQSLAEAQARRTQAAEANARIGEVYHPFDLENGKKQDAPLVESLLGACFEQIEQAAVDLSEKCHQRIAKGRRVLPQLVATVAFFFAMVDRILKENPLPPRLQPLFLDLLLPAKYLALAAGRERKALKRHAIAKRSQDMIRQFRARTGPFGRGDPTLDDLEKLAQSLAYLFQRSSSAVEGRNARLSLRHQGIHQLSPAKLRALTVMHNFYSTRPDQTTAAERFFENKPLDLFEWLLNHMEVPARPRNRKIA
jgi:hypothetical protein